MNNGAVMYLGALGIDPTGITNRGELATALNEAVGVKGCMIMTKDGMLVTSRLGESLSEEIVAAMASSIFLLCTSPLGM